MFYLCSNLQLPIYAKMLAFMQMCLTNYNMFPVLGTECVSTDQSCPPNAQCTAVIDDSQGEIYVCACLPNFYDNNGRQLEGECIGNIYEVWL